MIKYLCIENFKSLRSQSLGLAPLNLFFGINGMGKSSVIQSLLLLRQSYFKNGNLSRLNLNGELAELGTVKDIYSYNAKDLFVRFYMKETEGAEYDCSYDYLYGHEQDDFMSGNVIGNHVLERSALFNDSFSYLSAEHIGPRKLYDTENALDRHCTRFGTFGEYVVPYLAVNGDTERVPEGLCLDDGKSDRLIDQVSAWMRLISPGAKVHAEILDGIEKAKLSLSYVSGNLESNKILPVNTGFGIPYALPLIVELLTSKKDGLVIMENPESHLHPRGQSMIAKLIVKAAAAGTQIICESHSDHIINSICLDVKNKIISPDDVAVSYFYKDDEQDSRISELYLDEHGILNDYPEGLLDEWGILSSQLILK